MVCISWQCTLFLVMAILTMGCSPSGYTGTAKAQTENECVVVLHGLARSSWSMDDMAENVEAAGYLAVNIDYPSRNIFPPLSTTVVHPRLVPFWKKIRSRIVLAQKRSRLPNSLKYELEKKP